MRFRRRCQSGQNGGKISPSPLKHTKLVIQVIRGETDSVPAEESGVREANTFSTRPYDIIEFNKTGAADSYTYQLQFLC
jgi:hypothetical protein